MADGSGGTEGGAQTSIGAAVLLGNGNAGWEPQALLLTTPLVLLRFSRGVSRLYAAGSDTPFHVGERAPLELLQDVLTRLQRYVPKAGPKAGKPSFPMAMIAASYEFGSRFDPHQGAFPHARDLQDDEFFAAVYIDAYRPDNRGDTERIGYAGSIPAGWMENAPALTSGAYGHDAPPIVAPPQQDIGYTCQPLVPTMEQHTYESLVRRLQEYIAAGDIYQGNLTVRWTGRTRMNPEELFDRGLTRGGASFAGMFLTATGTVVSFSPELLLRRRGQRVETRPIKGSAAVPPTVTGIVQASEALTQSAKDRAEHVMIVDLERNDLGRVCEAGSVEVESLMRLVQHPTIAHLESTVAGKLRPGLTFEELFASVFPGGSVTGAPKKRALEILGETEAGPRGIYCGAFGWVDVDGDCELNLPIRTAVIRHDGTVEYHSGGGIVADSVPAEEWKELHDKARFFRDLLGE